MRLQRNSKRSVSMDSSQEGFHIYAPFWFSIRSCEGKPAASIGFGLAVDNLLMALSRQKISLPKKTAPVILTYTEANRCEAIREAQELRSKGTSVALRREKEDC